MELACRGRAAADEDADYSRRSPDPPRPHGAGDAMLVIRDALLLQLQKDRLRQEVIMAELAKLERSMSLCCTPRHGIDTTYLEQPKPQFFTFNEESMPQYRWSEHCSNVDEVHDLKKKDGKHGSVLLKSGKPATSTEDRFSVCSRSCCSSAKAEENNEAFGEQKLQESNEPKKMPPSLKWELTGITIPVKKPKTGITIPVKKPKTLQSWSCAICQVEAPNTAYNIQQHCAGNKHRSNVAAMESRNKAISQKAETTVETRPSSEVQQTMPQTPPSSIKWSCAICQAKATSEGNLQMHFAGQKHQRKVAALLSRKNANCQKATPAAEQARDVRQFSAEKPQPIWLCRFCQSKCTCKSDMENHLRGKRHKAKIQALLEECKNMVRSFGLTEAKLEPNIVTQDEENPESKWNCSLCQAKCTRQSELENHLKGKRHQLNFLVLQVEGQQYLSEWGCGICQAKCKSASQFEDHCMGRGHQQKIEALLRGGMNANSSGSQAVKKPPSDASNNKGGSSEEMATQKALYFCKLCNLLCNSKNTLAEHRRGKKHTEKVEKRMSSSYCKVCNLQCNSEKMLAHYCTGKTHLAKVNGC